MAMSTDNKYIVTGASDNSIKILDLEERKEIHCWKEEVEAQVDYVAISSDGQYIFAGMSTGSMLMLEMKTKKLVKKFIGVHTDRFFGLAISKNMDFLTICRLNISILIL